MNRHSLIASSLLACAALAIPACTVDRDTSPYAGQPDPDRPNVNPRIITSTPDLMVALGFDEPIVVSDSGNLRVAVPTRSLGDERYLLDYRFVFYDDRGMEVEPVMGWRMFSLEPREQRRVEAQALDARARDWRLQIKWANR